MIWKSKVTSTNLVAKDLITNNKPQNGAVILADYQSEGRGQSTNSWYSSKGKNLLCSIILFFEDLNVSDQFYLNKALSIGVLQGIKSFCNSQALHIKWPNDIYFGTKKIAGLLIENSIQNKQIVSVILGIGCNVNEEQFPPDLPMATSLYIETGELHNVQTLLASIGKQLEESLDLVKRRDFEQIDNIYHSHLLGLHELRDFKKNGKKIKGIIRGVDDMGRLILETDGIEHRFSNKEIEFT